MNELNENIAKIDATSLRERLLENHKRFKELIEKAIEEQKIKENQMAKEKPNFMSIFKELNANIDKDKLNG
jgi:uncharacterized protein YktA (UPF0223 family)